MMTAEEMKKEFYGLYDMMAMSHDVNNMRTFGNVHKEMMEWMIQNKPDLAQEWIGKLESIKWCNYLTPKEAEKIVSEIPLVHRLRLRRGRQRAHHLCLLALRQALQALACHSALRFCRKEKTVHIRRERPRGECP